MPTKSKRSYEQFCGLARALDVVGERWTLLIIRELLLGTRRYSELLTALPGITTNLLADRLKELTHLGLITEGYMLTEAGAALEPAIMELARWGGRFMDSPKKHDTVDPGWMLLSLKRRYVGGLACTIGVCVEKTWFTLTFEPQWLRVTKQRPERSAASLHLSRGEFIDVFVTGHDPRSDCVDGDARVIKNVTRALLPRRFASELPPSKVKTRFTIPLR
ncbi:MAG: hypothetical protein DI536_28085 [Archangium gephyra]|uniref:HTH hxlR-type domain-containing protein n=1 Tax=Archangium gephyra TaxID=48 RepID=A0A2W5SX02_9BACT|nr:MAG: hypothetical protein DI536_28085 [Archangium gephyra]